MIGAEILRGLLVADVVGMFALAAVYLRQRRLLWHQYLGWGLVALVFPVFGPFLVIASHPGEARRHPALRRVYESDTQTPSPKTDN